MVPKQNNTPPKTPQKKSKLPHLRTLSAERERDKIIPSPFQTLTAIFAPMWTRN